MKTSRKQPGKPGFVSYLLVLSSGVVLLLLMLNAYDRAVHAHAVTSEVQLRTDYAEKEDAVLRSIIAITPNRAMRTMQDGSGANADAANHPLNWTNIFNDALQLANASTSVPSALIEDLELEDHVVGNAGDAGNLDPARIFKALPGGSGTGLCTVGINANLGVGFPPALSKTSGAIDDKDLKFPLISDERVYSTALANAFLSDPDLNGDGTTAYGVSMNFFPSSDTRSRYNVLKYPDINFAYTTPGEPFVAKRNWWAFSMDLSADDAAETSLFRKKREFVLSIYEIPTQLPISGSDIAVGTLEDGSAWENIEVDGAVFGDRVSVEGDKLDQVSARNAISFGQNAEIGGKAFDQNSFKSGKREQYQIDNQGAAMPISLASESGRAAFIPINRGNAFFDRYANPIVSSTVLPSNRWNQYSVGAHQCAMRVEVIGVNDPTLREPTLLRFTYKGVDPLNSTKFKDVSIVIPALGGVAVTTSPLSAGFEDATGNTMDFGGIETHVAFGTSGAFYYKKTTGVVVFTAEGFGLPSGTPGTGFYLPASGGRSSLPFDTDEVDSTPPQQCVIIYPERFANYLALLGAPGTAVNHSVVVNVDYSDTGIKNNALAPEPTPKNNEIGLVVYECENLSSFPNGFSIVSSLRTWIGDDFNGVSIAPPAGYSPTGPFYPPTSIYCPEIRYGVSNNVLAISVDGSVHSLASGANSRPVAATSRDGTTMGAGDITMNLSRITHPAELPPITMMNWLVVLEEIKAGR